jgi:hypothetical protein
VDGGGFPANLQATMIVDAKYIAPASNGDYNPNGDNTILEALWQSSLSGPAAQAITYFAFSRQKAWKFI